MRNLVIVGLVLLLAIGGYLFANRTDSAAPVQSTLAVAKDATENVADTISDAASDTAEIVSGAATDVVETVEESAAVISDDAEKAEHDMRVADAKQSTSSAVSKPKSDSKYKKGTHYQEFVPAQPKVTGTDKIEVVEVFWYGCTHCFAFDPYVQQWEAGLDSDVTFIRMPAIWNATLETHAKAFYTAEILSKSGALKNPGAFHDAFFAEIHKNRQPLASPRSIQAFFERFGVTPADYEKAFKSFELDQKVRTAKDLTRRYKVSGVPAVVVNGKYTNLSNSLKGYEDYIGLMDALVDIER